METYKIPYTPAEKQAVVNILSTFNDVIINNLEDTGAFITIQSPDPEVTHRALLARIDREVRSSDIITIRYQ
jgi:hypothetical protein